MPKCDSPKGRNDTGHLCVAVSLYQPALHVRRLVLLQHADGLIRPFIRIILILEAQQRQRDGLGTITGLDMNGILVIDRLEEVQHLSQH